MIPKKTEAADLGRLRPMLFSIGLVISLLLIIIAMKWTQPIQEEVDMEMVSATDFEKSTEIPVTEIPPPPPPKVLEQPRLVEVPNEENIEKEIDLVFDNEVTELTVSEEFTIVEKVEVVKEEETNEVFVVVEKRAEPKNGWAEFYSEIGRNMVYPREALRMGIEGRVFLQFVVNKDGTLTDITVIKGIGFGCDEEALRVVSQMPSWDPAKQRGRPVRYKMVLPITFKIQQRSI